MQKIRVRIDRLIQHLDLEVLPQHFLPQNLQLHLCQPVAQATMDTETERHVLARAAAVDDELVGAGVMIGALCAFQFVRGR